MNPITRFLLAVAGSNRNVLEYAPRDIAKQASLGGTLLTTAGLAGVAGALALWMALDVPVWASAALGALWGLAILNLDRWLIVSTPRLTSKASTLAMAAPRVLLAVLIGLVVSTPLTLQIFKVEIDSELVAMHTEELEAFETGLREDPRFADLPETKEQIQQLENDLAAGIPVDAVSGHPEVSALADQLAQVRADYDVAEQAVACEKDGTCGSGIVGAGPAFEEKKDRRDRLATEVGRLQAALDDKTAFVRAAAESSEEISTQADQARLESLQAEVSDAESKRAAEVAVHDATVENAEGLLSRLEALQRLTESNWILQLAHIMLFLFLTAMECLPILFKTLLALTKPTLYESLSQMEDDRGVDRAKLRLDVEHAEAMAVAQAALEAAKARSATQLDAEVRTAQVVLDAQVDLANKAVRKWKTRQSELIDEELEALAVSSPGDMLAEATVTSATILPGQNRRR